MNDANKGQERRSCAGLRAAPAAARRRVERLCAAVPLWPPSILGPLMLWSAVAA